MNRIKELRKAEKMKQTELCAILGVSQSALSSWENGKFQPDDTAWKQLANIFNVSLDYLMGRSDIKKEPTTPQDDELSNLIKDPKLKELYDVLTSLDDEEIESLLTYAEFLTSNRDDTQK